MPQTGVYEHHKGQRYEVLGCARHTETNEEFVVYRALYGNYDLWVRPSPDLILYPAEALEGCAVSLSAVRSGNQHQLP